MPSAHDLRVKLFADGADLPSILELAKNPSIRGFTTNPTLMRKAGVADYEAFARRLLAAVPDRPVSLEVFADEFDDMARQARRIASWGAEAGAKVNVKIPITNTRRECAGPLIAELSREGVALNVTAIMTTDQVRIVADAVDPDAEVIVSVFAGRIADTGRDPEPMMLDALQILEETNAELLWASPREVFNVWQADAIGCNIITATPELLKKIELAGKDLDDYSLETVAMFRRDAVAAAFAIA